MGYKKNGDKFICRECSAEYNIGDAFVTTKSCCAIAREQYYKDKSNKSENSKDNYAKESLIGYLERIIKSVEDGVFEPIQTTQDMYFEEKRCVINIELKTK